MVLYHHVLPPPLFPQLCAFGESVVLEHGQVRLFPPEPSNVYLPYLQLLPQDALQMGK